MKVKITELGEILLSQFYNGLFTLYIDEKIENQYDILLEICNYLGFNPEVSKKRLKDLQEFNITKDIIVINFDTDNTYNHPILGFISKFEQISENEIIYTYKHISNCNFELLSTVRIMKMSEFASKFIIYE